MNPALCALALFLAAAPSPASSPAAPPNGPHLTYADAMKVAVPGEPKATGVCGTGDETACRAACQKKDGISCVVLGDVLALKQTDADTAAAAEAFRSACDLQVMRGCASLGFLTLRTKGQEAAAAALFQKSCGAGDNFGCLLLADFTISGVVVKKDEARALELYQQVCKAGHAPTCWRLGKYWEGQKDSAKAAAFLKQACDLGMAPACK